MIFFETKLQLVNYYIFVSTLYLYYSYIAMSCESLKRLDVRAGEDASTFSVWIG